MGRCYADRCYAVAADMRFDLSLLESEIRACQKRVERAKAALEVVEEYAPVIRTAATCDDYEEVEE